MIKRIQICGNSSYHAYADRYGTITIEDKRTRSIITIQKQDWRAFKDLTNSINHRYLNDPIFKEESP